MRVNVNGILRSTALVGVAFLAGALAQGDTSLWVAIVGGLMVGIGQRGWDAA